MDDTGIKQSEGSAQAMRADSREVHEARMKEVRENLERTCAELFPEPVTITLEIGCGHGHFLTAYALEHQDETCVGVDLVTKRVQKGRNKKEKRALEKLHFIKAEALGFLEALPEHVRIGRCFVLFPDPWPKKRHWKNRIVQSQLLEMLAARRTPDCQLCLRTDHEGYFEWMVEQVAASTLWAVNDEVEWPFEASSFFQELMDAWQSLIATKPEEDEPQGA
ncbi:MAG: methyltransferase domain-containing protein [Opitutales bacterium]|nr:methyltransferase domain-containing protein [Opitutales bacterium]